MSTYHVVVAEQWVRHYYINAENALEAEQLVAEKDRSGASSDDVEFELTMPQSEWFIEKLPID